MIDVEYLEIIEILFPERSTIKCCVRGIESCNFFHLFIGLEKIVLTFTKLEREKTVCTPLNLII